MHQLIAGAATVRRLQLHLRLELPVVGPVSALAIGGLGSIALNSGDDVLGNDADQALALGLGIRAKVSPSFAVRLDGRQMSTAAVGDGNTSHFELLAGIELRS